MQPVKKKPGGKERTEEINQKIRKVVPVEVS